MAAGKGHVRDGPSEGSERSLEKRQCLPAALGCGSGGLLNEERNCGDKGEKYSSERSRKAH